MTRHKVVTGLGCVVVCLVSLGSAWANPPGEAKSPDVDNLLKIKTAMMQAEAYMHDSNPTKAVEVLEANLFRIDGDRKFLALLRVAYLKCIPNLYLNNQHKLAKKYLNRLRILDPEAADFLKNQPTAGLTKAGSSSGTIEKSVPEKPSVQKVAQTIEKPAHPLVAVHLPTSSHQTQPTPPQVVSPAIKVRANNNDEKPALPNPQEERRKQALALLRQAQSHFNKGRYSQALPYFDQAHQMDNNVGLTCRNLWAYCKLDGVMKQLKQADTEVLAWSELRQQVQVAVSLEPNLKAVGDKMLEQIDRMEQSQKRAFAPVAVQHHTEKFEEWQIAETAHFRIFHKQAKDFVEQVGQVAEKTRTRMIQKWFAGQFQSWKTKCDIYLHDTAEDYHQATKVHKQSPGHSRIVETKMGDVKSRSIHLHCDQFDLLPVVLPHETTHVVLAGQFRGALPRWVDEGVAVLTEPVKKIQTHLNKIKGYFQKRQLFSLQELVNQPDYPPAEQIHAFYAQSVSLVDFLTRQKDPLTFTQFVRDGMKNGYQSALRQHYGFQDFGELQNRWSQHVLGSGGEAFVSTGQ